MQSRRFSGLPLIGILAIIYFIAGKLGLMLASLHASASPVWPSAGIALAALLLLGYRAWAAIFVGAFLVNVTTAGNVATSLAIATGNTLEGLVGVWLVNRFAGGTYVFDRPQGVFKFALAAGISTVLSPAIRFTQRETSTGIFILSAIAVWGTLHGFGPFASETENQSLLALQWWTAVLSITAMALSAGTAERRRLEEELQQQKVVVESGNRTKDHFPAMLSHELRTPITSVISPLKSLETERAQTKEDRCVEPTPDLQLRIAHLLLMDVAGYSKLSNNEQIELLQQLNQIVRSTKCFRAAEASGKLNR